MDSYIPRPSLGPRLILASSRMPIERYSLVELPQGRVAASMSWIAAHFIVDGTMFVSVFDTRCINRIHLCTDLASMTAIDISRAIKNDNILHLRMIYYDIYVGDLLVYPWLENLSRFQFRDISEVVHCLEMVYRLVTCHH